MDVVVHLHVEIGIPDGDSGGKIQPGLGRELMITLHMFEPKEIFVLRLFCVDCSIKNPSRRGTVSDHKPYNNPFLFLQCLQFCSCNG
jgi:hypothetical protein